MMATETLDEEVKGTGVKLPKKGIVKLVIFLVLIAMLAFTYDYARKTLELRQMVGKNYHMVAPDSILGWHKVERKLVAQFAYEPEAKDARIAGGSAGTITPGVNTNELDQEALIAVAKRSAQQPGYKYLGVVDKITVDYTEFALVRRDSPQKMLLNALAARGNDSFTIELAVSGPIANRAAALERYTPIFKNFVQSVRFEVQHDTPDSGEPLR